MTLGELRNKYGLSQMEAARQLGISVRTYIRYEKDEDYGDGLKRRKMEELIQSQNEITEEKGLLTVHQIQFALSSLFETQYPGQIEFCYLFGSYAKGYATEQSDVDLCVSTSLTGLRFAGLSEAIHLALNKNVDLVRVSNLGDNPDLMREIMKDGIRIYKKPE